MINWPDTIPVYLHVAPVDFRKAINGLSVIVSDEMNRSPLNPALYVFCNKRRTQLKVLYWDDTGFALWQKRLEKEKFKWPKQLSEHVVTINTEQWHWLLRGFDITQLKSHETLSFKAVS